MQESGHTIFDTIKNSADTDPADGAKFDLFQSLGKYAILFLVGVITLIAVIAFKDYIFFGKLYVFKGIGCDSLDALYPYIYNSADFIAWHQLPSWSFNFGMGQNTFPFFLRDPFDIFLYLSDRASILNGIVILELLKIILSGILFFFYLKQMKLSDFTAITGSLFFAFCSYIILGGAWHFFSFEVVNLAILLLALELLLSQDKWALMILPAFFIGVTMPLNYYFFGLFTAGYLLLRLVQTGRLEFKFVSGIVCKIVFLSCIGILISGPFLLENFSLLLNSPRVGGNNSYTHILSSTPIYAHSQIRLFGTCILRLFSNDILGAADQYKGWKNTFEAPMFYCGLPCIVLLPQLFPFLGKRVRIFFLGFLGLWLVPVLFPWFRYAFWLFSGNYFRVYSFFISVIIIYYSVYALEFITTNKKANFKILLGTIIASAIMLYYPYFNERNVINAELQAFALVMIITYSCIIYLLGKRNSEPYLKLIFIGLLFFELCYHTNNTVSGWNALTYEEAISKKGFNDYTKEAVAYLNQHDTSFYRIDKNYLSSASGGNSFNEGLIQGYNGTPSYSSFNQLNYINYLQLNGLINPNRENESRWARGLTLHPIQESQNCVKYFLVKRTVNPEWYLIGDSISKTGDVLILKNKLALPFGYTYDHFIQEKDFRQLNNYYKTCASILACVIQDADTNKVRGLKELTMIDLLSALPNGQDTIVNEIELMRNQYSLLTHDTFTVQTYRENYFKGVIDNSVEKVIYFSIPFDKGWKVTMDGHETDKLIVNGGMTGILLPRGKHDIELKYSLPYFYKGLILSLIGLLLLVSAVVFKQQHDKIKGKVV